MQTSPLKPHYKLKTPYILHFKKWGWLSVLIFSALLSVSASFFAPISFLAVTALSPTTLVGITSAIILRACLPIIQNTHLKHLKYLVPIIALFTPASFIFNFIYLSGLLMNQGTTHSVKLKNLESVKDKNHEVSNLITMLKKLSNKTGIVVAHKYLRESKIINAYASGRLSTSSNTMLFNKGILHNRISNKERKAVIAHELGHLANRDLLFARASRLFWNIATFTSFFVFSFPVALAMLFINYCAYYGLAQAKENLADHYSAKFSNPRNFIAFFEKCKEIEKPQSEKDSIKSKTNVAHKVCCYLFRSHPPTKERKMRLTNYAIEREQLKKQACGK